MAANLAVRSSLPLQVLLYLNQWYYIFWLIVEALAFVFKGQTLPFADGILAGEIIFFIVLFIVDMFRIFFATKGNLTERNVGIVVSLIMTLPCIAGTIYIHIYSNSICFVFFYQKINKLCILKALYTLYCGSIMFCEWN